MKKKFIPLVEKMLGQVLVERNIISARQLAEALDRQKSQRGKRKYIGEILIEMGVSQDLVKEALEIYDKRKPLGQIFVDMEVITPDQLRKALAKQSQLANLGIRKPLGRLLISMEFVSQVQYLEAISKHFNLPVVPLREFMPTPEHQKAVGEAYARRNHVVVLGDYPGKIKIALAEPNPVVMDEIKRAFPPAKRVEFFLAHPAEIDMCLRKKVDPFSMHDYR
ncbi:MAG TPA: hypothetical protein VLS90_16415 [Thermodesulfobacteriota bacterium]|nr:hypothetical protein [Thermodesulfobacteriota bacterium]